MPVSVRLEALREEDLHALARAETPERLGKVAPGALPPAFVARRSLSQLADGKPLFWCATFLIRDSTDRVVGGCGFKDAPTDQRVEIGYAVAPDHRKRGIATEALSAMLDMARASHEVTTVIARIDPDNIASVRVVQKLGFTSVGLVHDEDGDRLVEWLIHLASPTLEH